MPSQVSGLFDIAAPSQLRAAHSVPAENSWQLAVPEHTPVLPQVAAASVAHSSSGSSPAGIGEHTPALPARLHFSQVPPQRASQHTPSAQMPVMHSPSAVHAAAAGFL